MVKSKYLQDKERIVAIKLSVNGLSILEISKPIVKGRTFSHRNQTKYTWLLCLIFFLLVQWPVSYNEELIIKK